MVAVIKHTWDHLLHISSLQGECSAAADGISEVGNRVVYISVFVEFVIERAK